MLTPCLEIEPRTTTECVMSCPVEGELADDKQQRHHRQQDEQRLARRVADQAEAKGPATPQPLRQRLRLSEGEQPRAHGHLREGTSRRLS